MPQPGFFVLHSRAVPPLPAGDYTLTGNQSVTGGMREANQAITAAIKTNDTAAMSQAANTIGTLTAQMQVTNAKAEAAVYALLTPDQQSKYQPGGMRGMGMGMGHEGHMMGFFAKYLDLTDAQRTQMKAVMQKEHATMKPLMQQVHQLDQQLRQYVEGAYDDAKVQALVSQQAQTLVQMKVQETRIHNELFQMLTPDQQAKMKEFEARHEARMQKHMSQEGAAAPVQQ